MSTSSTVPLWGQAWELTVISAAPNGQATQTVYSANSLEPEALRITFEVLQTMIGHPFWFADINIYNLNAADTQNLLFNATWVTLKAGFQTGPTKASTIWSGPVLQVLFDRENVVDQRITLHCIANPLVMNNVIAFSQGVFASQQQIVATMAANIGLPPIDPGQGNQSQLANQMMTAKRFPRGYTCFGKVGGYLETVANDNLMATFRDGQKAYLTEMSNKDLTPTIVYCPPLDPNTAPGTTLPNGVTASIIGTPQQTPFGIIFTVLLDPRLQLKLPPMVIAIDRDVVFNQISIIPTAGQNTVTPYTSNLSFLVSQVRHTGDSRGNDWQTEITGYSTTYADQLLNGIFASQQTVSVPSS